MQNFRRDHGDGGGGGSPGGSGSSSTASRSSESSVSIITTTSTQTATPTTTVTTLITSVNITTNPTHSSSNPTGGGTHSSSLSTQIIPTGAAPPSSPTNTPTSTSTSPLPSTPHPVFLFDNLTNATLCSSFNLSWTYSGQPSVAMTLIIQQSTPRSDKPTTTTSYSPSGPLATMRILTTNVLANADTFSWSLVDVMEGWYIAKAFDTSANLGISAGSVPFFVTQGSDISCLLVYSTPITSSTAAPSQTPPSNASNSKPSLGTGDIIGITLGVTAGAICLLLALFTLPRLKRNDPSMMNASTTKQQRPYLLY